MYQDTHCKIKFKTGISREPYANLELVPTLLKLRRVGSILFHVKIVFAYHAKLVK